MPSALVTGGAGFIGSWICRALLAEGWSVHVADDLSTGRAANLPGELDLIEVDLGAKGAFAQLPRLRYDVVCHLAGQSSGEKSFEDPERDLEANARSTVALAVWARDREVPLVVHASSMGVYGDAAQLPICEDSHPRPVSFYGASKLSAEHALAVAPDLRAISLRMFSIYGPGQDLAEMRQGMVSIFLAMALQGNPIQVRGPLDRVRDFVYIEDCVDVWLRAVASRPSVAGAFNVGSGTGTPIRDLVSQLLVALDAQGHPVEELAMRTAGDQYAVTADTRLAQRVLGWRASTQLADGLDRMVRWARTEVS